MRELLRAGAYDVDAAEIDAGRLGQFGKLPGVGLVLRGDFLRMTQFDFVSRFHLVVMNPPFADAQAHVEHAISLLAPGGTVASLLRLAFCAAGCRAAFRKAHPFGLYPMAARPSFTAEALNWMTEADLLAIRKQVKATPKAPAHLEMLDEVRARLRGSDSADYAWVLFGEGHGGHFGVLEGKGER